MTQTLVIVESAAKSKTIQNYLGGGYVVRACFGHVRDLPTDRMGVDVDRDFAAEYVVPEGRARVVKELKAEVVGQFERHRFSGSLGSVRYSEDA